MSNPAAVRGLDDLRQRVGSAGTGLAAHAAVPVLVTPTLLNLLRTTFFLDPPEILAYDSEAALLLSPAFRSIGSGLYQLDDDVRDLLLAELDLRYGRERAKRVAELLYRYSVEASPWVDLPQLDAAQRLTAHSLLDPDGARAALEASAASGGRQLLDQTWHVAMRERLERTAEAAPSRFFDQAVDAAHAGEMDLFVRQVQSGLARLSLERSAPWIARALLQLGDRLPEKPDRYLRYVAAELDSVLDVLERQFPKQRPILRQIRTEGAPRRGGSLPPWRWKPLLDALLDQLGTSEEGPPRTKVSWAVERTGAPAAWSEFGADGSGVRIALIATGMDPSHPDLTQKGFEWVDHSDEATYSRGAYDRNGYGTMMASLIVGGDASGEVIGMAPKARLLIAKALDGKGTGTDAYILKCLDWALANRADVVVVSLGSPQAEISPVYRTVYERMNRAGITVVGVVGNDGPGTLTSPGNQLLSISAGATDAQDELAPFSSGATVRDADDATWIKPDLVAPGVDVPAATLNGAWKPVSGTSPASALVAGAVALLLSATSISRKLQGPDRTELIKQCLYTTATDLGSPGQDERYGWGLVDVYRAIREAWTRGYKP